MLEDTANSLRKENKLLTRLSIEGEKEGRIYKAEIERLRGEVAKYEHRNKYASIGCQTFTVYIENRGERDLLREELPLLRKQSEDDHVRMAELTTELNTVTHERDMIHRQMQRGVKESKRIASDHQKLSIAYRAEVKLNEQANERISQLETQLNDLSQHNTSLSTQDWRQFWERKSTIQPVVKDVYAVPMVSSVLCMVSVLILSVELVSEISSPAASPVLVATDVVSPVVLKSISSSPFQTIKQLRAAAKDRQTADSNPISEINN